MTPHALASAAVSTGLMWLNWAEWLGNGGRFLVAAQLGWRARGAAGRAGRGGGRKEESSGERVSASVASSSSSMQRGDKASLKL